MNSPFKILGVWLGPDLQVEKNLSSKVAIVIRTWTWRWLSLKRRMEPPNLFIVSIITYPLTVVLCPDLWLADLLLLVERIDSTCETIYRLSKNVKR